MQQSLNAGSKKDNLAKDLRAEGGIYIAYWPGNADQVW